MPGRHFTRRQNCIKIENMQKGLLIGLVILVGVAVGALAISQSAGRQKAEVEEGAQVSQQFPAPGNEGTPEMVVSTDSASPGKEIVVSGGEYSFSPASISLTQGETVKVTFKNTGGLPHNFVITELGISTKTIPGGQEDSVTFTVEKTGIYTFFCSVGDHQQRGMEGEIKVN